MGTGMSKRNLQSFRAQPENLKKFPFSQRATKSRNQSYFVTAWHENNIQRRNIFPLIFNRSVFASLDCVHCTSWIHICTIVLSISVYIGHIFPEAQFKFCRNGIRTGKYKNLMILLVFSKILNVEARKFHGQYIWNMNFVSNFCRLTIAFKTKIVHEYSYNYSEY
jgi:hypothetical protein